jgi:competence protein ComEC
LSLWIGLGVVTAERSILSLRPQRDELRCTFVAVGHGTSCLIEFADGRTLLYDGGHMGTPQGSANAISAVLWSRGITHLDAIMISHADSDHYNAVPELLERFSVGTIFVSPVMFYDEPGGVKKLREAIERRKVPLQEVYGGNKLALGSAARSEVLHPPKRGVIGSDNANSIVLAIEYASQRLLLPGDLERNGLVDVLAEEPLPSQIVMAPHHGSASSNPRGFAQWSSPKWVVISGARSRDATEVIDAYRSFGAEVLHTAHDGALCFTLSATGLKVETWHDDAWHERKHRGESRDR